MDRIYWLRPGWAAQLPDGDRRYRLGTTGRNRLRVDDPSHYYVLAGGFSPTDSLVDRRPLDVTVAPLATGLDRPPAAAFVLDVDLDVFATRNPAADRLRSSGLTESDLEAIRETFSPVRLGLPEEPEARIAFVDRIRTELGRLTAGTLRERLAATLWLWRAGIGPGDLVRIYHAASRAMTDLTIDEFLLEGRRVVGVPERLEPTNHEIDATHRALRRLFEQTGRPRLVTIARSVDDGFTPRAVWRQVEPQLLRDLEDAFGALHVRYRPGLQPVTGGR